MVTREHKGRHSLEGGSPMSSQDVKGPGHRHPADGVFDQVGAVAVAAILNMFRLVAGELVLLRSKPQDSTWFEQAVRKQLDQFTSPTNDQAARAAGLECARYLIEQVLAQIRAQAEIKRALSASEQEPNVSSDESPKFMLN